MIVPGRQVCRLGTSVAAALLSLVAIGARAQVESSHEELIRLCSERADPDVQGMEQLEAECPGLGRALSASGYDAFISEHQREWMTASKLVDLGRLAERYREPPSTRSLDPDALESVLAALDREPEQRPGWFARLKNWLRSLFAEADAQSSSWLRSWLSRLEMSPAVQRVMLYGGIAMVILIALAVLVNELRVAGVWRGSRRRSSHAGSPVGSAPDPDRATLADLEALPLTERPSMLLRMIAAHLMRSGRLMSEKSLTHRELVRAAAFEAEGERVSFGRVARLAEQLRYGGISVPNAQIEEVVREGSDLAARLAGAEAAT
jgi:hypothetical protein